MSKFILPLILAAAIVLPRSAAADIVVYTAGPAGLINALGRDFNAQSGIKVNVFQATTGKIMARIESEATNPVADVVISASWDTATDFAKRGWLLDYDSPNAATVPGFLKSDGAVAQAVSALAIAWKSEERDTEARRLGRSRQACLQRPRHDSGSGTVGFVARTGRRAGRKVRLEAVRGFAGQWRNRARAKCGGAQPGSAGRQGRSIRCGRLHFLRRTHPDAAALAPCRTSFSAATISPGTNYANCTCKYGQPSPSFAEPGASSSDEPRLCREPGIMAGFFVGRLDKMAAALRVPRSSDSRRSPAPTSSRGRTIRNFRKPGTVPRLWLIEQPGRGFREVRSRIQPMRKSKTGLYRLQFDGRYCFRWFA